MTLGTASRTDWILNQVIAGKMSVEKGRKALQELADFLRSSKQEKEAAKVDAILSTMKG